MRFTSNRLGSCHLLTSGNPNISQKLLTALHVLADVSTLLLHAKYRPRNCVSGSFLNISIRVLTREAALWALRAKAVLQVSRQTLWVLGRIVKTDCLSPL